ncbi:unnamed protein product [Prunus armeniaca]
MLQDIVARRGGAGGDIRLACRKARRCRRGHKARVSQGDVTRHEGAGGTKLACRKAMWLGTMVPKATQSLHVARYCGWARRC